MTINRPPQPAITDILYRAIADVRVTLHSSRSISHDLKPSCYQLDENDVNHYTTTAQMQTPDPDKTNP